jgi:hypothetical protein
MKITLNTLQLINSSGIRLKLALALGFSETWIRSLIADNKENGPLTTAKALQVIREETGLDDSQILEEDAVKEGTPARQ